MILKHLKRLPWGTRAALLWMLLMVCITLFAQQLASYRIDAIDLRGRQMPPLLFGGTLTHPLGTDELGRDILSRLLLSIQTSFGIASMGLAIGAAFGITMGILAARAKGMTDQIISIAIDFQASTPYLVVALAVLAFLGNDIVLFTILVGFYGWERYARLARGLARAAENETYILAVRQLGVSRLREIFGHMLPNMSSTLIVSATLAFPEIILLESGLSFLGLGVQPPGTSLGNMVGYGREYIQSSPWIVMSASLVIVLTTISISQIGDWLRDTLDPTLA